MFLNDFKNVHRSQGIQKGGSFQEAMRPAVFLAQIFSLLPVKGTKGRNSSSLRFSWISFQIAYTLLALLGSGTMICITIFWLADNAIKFNKIGMNNNTT